jgi:hypothetical protein
MRCTVSVWAFEFNGGVDKILVELCISLVVRFRLFMKSEENSHFLATVLFLSFTRVFVPSLWQATSVAILALGGQRGACVFL